MAVVVVFIYLFLFVFLAVKFATTDGMALSGVLQCGFTLTSKGFAKGDQIEDKVIWITGGNRGIGKHVPDGVKVLPLDLASSEDCLKDAVEKAESFFLNVEVYLLR